MYLLAEYIANQTTLPRTIITHLTSLSLSSVEIVLVKGHRRSAYITEQTSDGHIDSIRELLFNKRQMVTSTP